MTSPTAVPPSPTVPWRSVLELDTKREAIAGSAGALRDAVRRGADMRVYTEFWWDEHLDTSSTNHELVKETMDFRVLYLLEDRWVAGVLTHRQPIDVPHGFGARPSMSLFMYNEDGSQAVARLVLDGPPAEGRLGPAPIDPPPNMPKYHQADAWDAGTNAPSQNFIYDFDVYKFRVRERWREAYANDATGRRVSGSLDDLTAAFAAGSEVKVAMSGLCDDLVGANGTAAKHEVIVLLGSCYYCTDKRWFLGAANPVVRISPAIPLRYRSRGWDVAWTMPRTDGYVALTIYDPYTLRPRKTETRCAMRWFVEV